MKKTLFLILFFIYSYSSFSQEKIVVDIKIRGVKKTKVSEIKKIIEVKNNSVLDSIVLQSDMIYLLESME